MRASGHESVRLANRTVVIDNKRGVLFVRQRVVARWIAITVLVASCIAAASGAADEVRSGGPYVPTPQPVVDEMLNLARVGPDDFVMDLGSGDGRIVLTAANRYRARGMGVDIDAELVDLSNAEARRQGVDKLVRFHQENVLQTRIGDATVITLYLLPELMHSLRDRIYVELKPGARVVSHDFSFIEWMPDRTVTLDVPEKYHIPGAWKSTVYLWVVPAKVGGRWHAAVSAAGAENFILTITQKFQRFEGNARHGNERMALADGQLEGNRIRFVLNEVKGGRKVSREFSGIVDGDTIRGSVTSRDGTAPWTATRLGASVQPQRNL